MMRRENRTNVRFWILSLYQAFFTCLEFFSVTWAAALAERLFRKAPRRKILPEERVCLAEAERLNVVVAGKRVAVWRWGEGPAALLVHGWGGNAAQMTPLVKPLRRAGFSVLAFDAPAHGASQGTLSSLPQFAAATAAVASRFGPIRVLVSHSMGGAAASLALAGGLAVERAVFLAPPADAEEWLVKFTRLMRLSARVAAAARQRMERRLKIRFDKLNARTLGPCIPTPLLVIHDRGDNEVVWYDGAAVAQSSVNGSLLTTEGLGHRRLLRDPAVLTATLNFLLQADRAPADFFPTEAEHCPRCGEPLPQTERAAPACAGCELELELADREGRWEREIASQPQS